jgi:transketolase
MSDLKKRPDARELKKVALELRKEILKMISKAGSGHPGGSLSMVELLVGLYWYKLRHDPKQPDWADRDLFLLSKGHGCPALYAVLAFQGYFPREELMTLRQFPTRLQGHPERGVLPGIEMSAGSLGQGLSMANGIAMSDRIDGKQRRIFCLMGDGEIQEGQVWEAAMTAHHNKLDSVCAIVDANQLQQNGPVKNIQDVEPLADKWKAFGWEIFEIDGHDIAKVMDAYEAAEKIKGKPQAIIARTIKGKGVSFMELNHAWHGVAPKKEELEKALKELEAVQI